MFRAKILLEGIILESGAQPGGHLEFYLRYERYRITGAQAKKSTFFVYHGVTHWSPKEIAMTLARSKLSPSRLSFSQRFKVRLWLIIVGPVRSRTKNKINKTFSAEKCFTLPFVPYPGMRLTLEQPRRKRWPLTLYLRVRTVEWCMPAGEFRCTVDEFLGDPCFDEAYEARRSPEIEEHFVKLQRNLTKLGFDLTRDVSITNRITKFADGTLMDPEEEVERQRLFRLQWKEWENERQAIKSARKTTENARGV